MHTHSRHRVQQVVHHDDVRVDVAEPVSSCMALGLGEDVTHQRSPVLIPRDSWDMTHAEGGCRVRNAFVVSEQDYFAKRPQESPAADGIALDHGDVAKK